MDVGGYLGLFLSAFLAATILPVWSEAVLVGLTASQGFDIALLWAVATLGNSLGALFNWVLARWFLRWQDRSWFPFKQDSLRKADKWFNKWGVWSLLLSWMPVIGDPITFAAGFLRVPLRVFIPLVVVAKGARYAVLIVITQGFL